MALRSQNERLALTAWAAVKCAVTGTNDDPVIDAGAASTQNTVMGIRMAGFAALVGAMFMVLV